MNFTIYLPVSVHYTTQTSSESQLFFALCYYTAIVDTNKVLICVVAKALDEGLFLALRDEV